MMRFVHLHLLPFRLPKIKKKFKKKAKQKIEEIQRTKEAIKDSTGRVYTIKKKKKISVEKKFAFQYLFFLFNKYNIYIYNLTLNFASKKMYNNNSNFNFYSNQKDNSNQTVI